MKSFRNFLCSSESLRLEQLLSRCKSELGIANIERQEALTNAQLSSCCERLLQLSDVIDLKGIFVDVTLYYSVMDDGTVCIPWNFVS